MPHTARHVLRAAALVAAVLAAACGGRGASSDATLKRDLDAASGDGLALAPRASATQVVSGVELGDGKASPSGAPAPSGAPTPRQTVTRPAASRAAPVRVVERVRVVYRDAAPEPSRASAARAEPAVAAAPAPAPSEPTPVAAPSPSARQLPPTDDGARRGRRRPWDMGDVIRNAPFPINPLRSGR